MSKFYSFFVTDPVLIEHLRRYGKGANSIDYELAAAVWLSRIFSELKQTEHCIAFESSILPKDFDFNNPEHIKEALDKRVQNTPIDFILVDGNPAKHASAGYGFQVKRFPYKQKNEDDFYDKLADFINIKANARPGEVALLVIPEPDGKFVHTPEKIKELHKKLAIPPNSYQKVILLMGTQGSAHLVEIHPEVKYFKAAAI